MEVSELLPGPLELVAPDIQPAAAAGARAAPGDGARLHQARPHLRRGCAGRLPVHQRAGPRGVPGGRQWRRVQPPGRAHRQHRHKLLQHPVRRSETRGHCGCGQPGGQSAIVWWSLTFECKH